MITPQLWRKYKVWVKAENKRIAERNRKRRIKHAETVEKAYQERDRRNKQQDQEWKKKSFFTKLLYGFERPQPFTVHLFWPGPAYEDRVIPTIEGFYDWATEEMKK